MEKMEKGGDKSQNAQEDSGTEYPDKVTDSMLKEHHNAEEVGQTGRCADVRLFTLNLCLLSLVCFSSMAYNIGVLRTVERRFDLSSTETGLMMSMNDISHILVVTVVGYFGGRSHIPKVMASLTLLVALAQLMLASPALFYRHTYTEKEGNDTTVAPKLCHPSWNSDPCEDTETSVHLSPRGPYYIFLAAQFIAGIGGSGIQVLGVVYLDENSKPVKTPLYLGKGLLLHTSLFCALSR